MRVLECWVGALGFESERPRKHNNIQRSRKPRTATMLVQDYIKPQAIRAGILVERDGQLDSKERREVSSLASTILDATAWLRS